MFKFNFYISGKLKFTRTYEADSLSAAWKLAHREATDYPIKRFIEIANVD